MKLPKRIAGLGALAGAVTVIALSALAGPASAQVTTGITAAPNPIQTQAVFSPTGQYEGDAGVLTVTVAANSTLLAGTPVVAEECNLDPTSQSSCDGLTLQSEQPGQSTQVIPNADGSVTFKMYLWELPTGNTPDTFDTNNNNPGGFDPGSTVSCWDAASDPNTAPAAGTAQPCSIWIGDSAANWTKNSFVVNGIQPEAAPATLLVQAPPTSATIVAGSPLPATQLSFSNNTSPVTFAQSGPDSSATSQVLATGTSTAAGTTTTLTDSSASWTPNQWAGDFVTTSVTGGSIYPIVSNTATTLTTSGTFSTPPAVGTTFTIILNQATPPPDLAVSSSGVVTEVGTLAPGTYNIGGTGTDSAYQSGFWTYALTVTAPPPTNTPAATTSTTAATTSTTAATTITTAATTSTTVSGTTTTTNPNQGAVPESPYVPLLPVGAAVVGGGGFLFYRLRHRRANS